MQSFFDETVLPVVLRSSPFLKETEPLLDALNSSRASLNELQSNMVQYIVKVLADDCSNHIKSANDIPRLYRRTNRDVPKTASNYVSLAVNVLHDFKRKYVNENKRSERAYEIVSNDCIRSVIDSICLRYQSIANDLLESVRKMEDSLRRLRKVRPDRSTASNLSNLANQAVTTQMSDDDKIRLQLYLDVVEFGNQLAERFDGYKGESNYEALFKLVDEINSNQSTTTTTTTNSQSSNPTGIVNE